MKIKIKPIYKNTNVDTNNTNANTVGHNNNSIYVRKSRGRPKRKRNPICGDRELFKLLFTELVQ
jgi:hypothetical protein